MLQDAVSELQSRDFRVIRASSVWETEPQDYREQGWFLNMVVEVETDLFPMQLLARVQRAESTLGRKRAIRKGPRTIDIDILLINQVVIDTEKLTVPHVHMHERRFVLAPLCELARELRHPVLRLKMSELLDRIKGQVVNRLEFRVTIPAIEAISASSE
jgi:2-amino-4-hydroxy-6-hydroxymethyldihydropteridine diphosphokinase